MILNETIVAKLEEAFAEDFGRYAVGYRDALESFALALQGTIAEGLLLSALEATLDAYSNNVDDDPEDDESWRDYDDGQPDELQEWHDFDPDC
jgi:hypothetical protein